MSDTLVPTQAEKTAFTYAFAAGFKCAEETSRQCISAMDDAWADYCEVRTTPNLATAVEETVPVRVGHETFPFPKSLNEQAKRNHGGQTLARLAERGGLCWSEAYWIINDIRWEGSKITEADAERQVRDYFALRTRAPTLPDDRDAVIAEAEIYKAAWDDLRRYIYDRDAARRERSIERHQVKLAALSKHDRNEGGDDGE